MSKGRATPYTTTSQAEADATLADFIENEVTIQTAGLMNTPAGPLPMVICAPHADLAAVVAYQHQHQEVDAQFESSYCLAVDSPAWIALKATFPLPQPRTLTWVFHLPARRTLLREVLNKNMLAIGIPSGKGALLFPDVVTFIRGPFTAYELGNHLYQTLRPARKAAQN